MMNESELRIRRDMLRQQAEALTQDRDVTAARLKVIEKNLAQATGALSILEQILAPQPDSTAPELKDTNTKGDQK